MARRERTPEEQELHELRKVEIVSKMAQAVLGIALLLTAFFLSRFVAQLDRLTDKVAELDTRVTVLEVYRDR
jgi:hypothetical protein